MPSKTDYPTSPLLSVADLVAGYWDYPVLSRINLQVSVGAFVSVIGPNGSGKSTLLKAVYGLVNVSSGEITLTLRGAGQKLRGLQPFQVTALGVNYLPQLGSIFPDMSVRENLEIGAILSRSVSQTDFDRVLDLFPALKPLLGKRAGTLSGGAQRMVAIGRAMMTSPQLLLLDEPSAGLAPNLVDDLFERIAEIHKSGVAILMVEQNARRALSMSDYAYVLDMGRNRFEGPGDDLIEDPKVVELYLGSSRGYEDVRRGEAMRGNVRP